MLSGIDPGKPAAIPGYVISDHIARLSRAASKREPLQPIMEPIVRELGFDSFMYAMSATATPTRRDTRTFVWTTLPREWVTLYGERGYIEVDPGVTRTWNRNVPFVWDAAEFSDDPLCRGFLDDAARFGVCSGVAVSFRDPDHGRVLVAVSSRTTPVDDARRQLVARQLGEIMLLATSFHDFFMAHLVDDEPALMTRAAPLSPRETQCLEMAANGMTSVDIGLKLGIKPRTANFHFGTIAAKLGVLNRKEAIAMGIARGLIRTNPVTMGRGASQGVQRRVT
ncbi:MAG: LuxR family transcriptional regulator [Burkholderiales bacterium]|jgi:DNA-binding CsgD family transcriptional regulator